MGRFGYFFLSAWFVLSDVDCAKANCYLYNSDKSDQLTGTIARKTFPGAPNFESVGDGDEAETGLYLVLAKPICVHPKMPEQDNFEQDEENVRLIQLIAQDDEDFRRLHRFTGLKVIIRGSFDHAFNGHHHTPVLLDNPKVLSHWK